MGAGHVNPERAINPGLVYNIMPDEYITHLCTLGYARSDIFTITHRSVNCHDIIAKNKGFSLNYPSLTVIFKHGRMSTMVKRRLTNVGSPNSTYLVEVMAPEGVKVRVKPRRLTFHHMYQTISYKVWFTSRRRVPTEVIHAQGHLTWGSYTPQLLQGQEPDFCYLVIKVALAIVIVATEINFRRISKVNTFSDINRSRSA